MSPDSRSPAPASPRAAVLTSSGRGAIATIAVCGARAVDVVACRFRPSNCKELTALAIGRAVFGRFEISLAAAEELVVGLVAPDQVEIHCHGGNAAAEAICQALVEQGCTLVTPEDWAGQQMADPLAAQALVALAKARTERSCAILLDQYRGALRNELTGIEQALAQCDRDTAARALDTLLARSDLGLHLCQPWKVVFAGRPNVGKSSLMNAILGYERSIVWPEPGTTRDVLVATTALDGWWVELSDVAGLRTGGEELETAGIVRAEQQIAVADVVVFVADVTAPWDAELYRDICDRISGDGSSKQSRVVIAHNKSDLANPPADGRPLGVATSALKKLGLRELCSAIVEALVPESPSSGAAVPFTLEQVRCLEAAAAELNRGNVVGAGGWIRAVEATKALEPSPVPASWSSK